MDNDAKNFVKACDEINKKLAEIGKKEVVSDELAFISEVIINNMSIADIGDALLFASALNALNTYVKQSRACLDALGYTFKKKVDNLIMYANSSSNEMIKLEIQRDNEMCVCIVEINNLQFSFHDITLNDENRKIIAKDFDDTTLSWDGIRKQRCAVSLFNFAKDNSYGRTNKMKDGTDFKEGLDKLLNDFNKGKLSLTDSKNSYYCSGIKAKTKSFDENKTYSFRNQILNVVYKNNIGNFIEEFENRTLHEKIFNTYEDGYGEGLPLVNKYEIKFAFESLYFIFKKSYINKDAGIMLLYYKMMGNAFPILVLPSKDSNGVINVSLIMFTPWERMSYAEDDIIEYLCNNGIDIKRAIHPSKFMNQASFYIEKLLNSFGEVKTYPCTYLFNAINSQDNDIISVADKNIIEKAPIFYSEDRNLLEEYICKSLQGFDGNEIIDNITNIREQIITYAPGDISIESKLLISSIVNDVSDTKNKLYIINVRRAISDNRFLEYINNAFNENNEKYSIFDGKIPSSIEELVYGKNILIYDFDLLSDDELIKFREFKEKVIEDGFVIEEKELIQAIGFNDFGAGINYVATKLRIANSKNIPYLRRLYQIKLINSERELSDKNGISSVIIPDSVTYDQIEDTIFIDESDRKIIYKNLLKGIKGVNLLIRNAPLKHYINNLLDDIAMRELKLSGSISDDVIDINKILQAKKLLLSGSAKYNQFSSMAIKSIGADAWKKLNEDSKTWIATALSEYYGLSNTDANLDFSGTVLLVSKTFEVELCKRIVCDYTTYIKNKYKDNYIDKLPEYLIEIIDGEKKLKNFDRVTLGNIPFTMGVDSKGYVYNEVEYNEFLAYAKEILFISTTDLEKNIKELCDIIYYVRTEFRNTSAHKSAISLNIATDCIEYCITIGRKLGVIMDMFRK